jgi:hypothetical protein
MGTIIDTVLVAANHTTAQSAALALVLMAGLLFAVARFSMRRLAASTHWPTVPGIVLESAVATTSNGHRQLYRPVVRYRYEVDGQRYEGSRIGWGALAGFRKFTRARRLLDGYRPGGTIAVYHDPQRPSLAVLQPDAAAGLRPVLLAAPTACVMLAIGCVYAAM